MKLAGDVPGRVQLMGGSIWAAGTGNITRLGLLGAPTGWTLNDLATGCFIAVFFKKIGAPTDWTLNDVVK